MEQTESATATQNALTFKTDRAEYYDLASPTEETPSDTYMMGLAQNEKLIAAMACEEGWQWGLIVSGSAVTAAGWAFGSQFDT